MNYTLKSNPTWQLVVSGWIEDSEMRLPGPEDVGQLEIMPQSLVEWIAQVSSAIQIYLF